METAAWLLLWTLLPTQASTAALPSSIMHKFFGVERAVDVANFPNETELAQLEENLSSGEHGWFDSVSEGAKLHYRKFVPAKPKAVLVYMHGIATHAGKGAKVNGRKLNLSLISDVCLKEGIALYAFDLYGHGFSEGTRVYVPSYLENMKDYVNFCHMAAKEHPSVPLVLMGESYGCCLTQLVARQFQDDPASGPSTFDSIILTAPAFDVDLPPYPVYLLLRYGFAPMAPKWRPFFMPNPISADRIWRDKDVLKVMTSDLYRKIDGSGIPLRLGTAVNVVVAVKECYNKAIPGFKVPYCIIHGTNDYGVRIEGSDYMWKTAVIEERAFHRKEGAYHDLFADPTAEENMQHVVDWVKSRLNKSK